MHLYDLSRYVSTVMTEVIGDTHFRYRWLTNRELVDSHLHTQTNTTDDKYDVRFDTYV